MKKVRFFALLMALLLLCGCTVPKEPTVTPPSESTEPMTDAHEEETIPAAYTELPEIAPQDRCAATAMGRMAETDAGYYLHYRYLYYADKADLTKWVLVCNKPDCKHRSEDKCPAEIGNPIWMKDGSIYTLASSVSTDEVVLCTPGDGSGWTCVYRTDSPPYNASTDVVYTTQFHQNGVCLNVCQMGKDGYWDSYLFFLDENGTHIYPYAEDFPDYVYSSSGNSSNSAWGDVTMYLPMAEPEGNGGGMSAAQELYRVSPEKVEKLEFPEGCSYYGAYLYGNTMIHYHPGDGFYRLNVAMGTEEKIADAAYENGFGFCLDGKFLVETTVNYQSSAETVQLRYLNGEEWIDVPLPEEFTSTTNLRIVALTSDALFVEDYLKTVYMVKLGDSQMVKCLEIQNFDEN